MPKKLPEFAIGRLAALGALAMVACALPGTASAAPSATKATGPSAIETQSLALQRASQSVLGLRAQAVADARSATTLGREREGSGVLIGRDGLVLTVGYLVLEAEQVELTTHDGRRIPARVVAYDQATGLGMVQALAPLGLEPAPLGEAASARLDEPVLTASGGEEGDVAMASLSGRRAFSAYWEYHLDSALFTVPARRDHAGAALFNLRGELLGVGALMVADVGHPGTAGQPGNLFVPVDVLKPVLAELLAQGRSQASLRAWLGVNCVESAGAVHVMRVSDDSPADVAGLQRGDRIVAIDDTPVAGLAVLWKTLWASAPPERAVRLDILRDGRPMRVVVHAVDRAWTLRRAEGI